MGLFDYFKNQRAEPVYKPESEPVEERTSAQEDLLSSIKKFRAQQSAVREKYLKESAEKLAPSKQKIARAEEFMSESGLEKSFTAVMKHICYWASWSKLDSFEEYTAFKVGSINGNKDGLNEWSLSFDYNDHHFQFKFKNQGSYAEDGSLYANMSLDYDDEKVLEISSTSNLDRQNDQWDYLSVSHLVIGDWVRHIVEMHELIGLYDLKRDRGYAESMNIDRAKNLPD